MCILVYIYKYIDIQIHVDSNDPRALFFRGDDVISRLFISAQFGFEIFGDLNSIIIHFIKLTPDYFDKLIFLFRK